MEKSTFTTKKGLAQMLKGGVIMDVVTPEQARIAEDAGAVAVAALEPLNCLRGTRGAMTSRTVVGNRSQTWQRRSA